MIADFLHFDVEVLAEADFCLHTFGHLIPEDPHFVAEPQKTQPCRHADLALLFDTVIEAESVKMRDDRSRSALEGIFGLGLDEFEVLADIASEGRTDIYFLHHAPLHLFLFMLCYLRSYLGFGTGASRHIYHHLAFSDNGISVQSFHRDPLGFFGGGGHLGELLLCPFGQMLILDHTDEFRTLIVGFFAVLEKLPEDLSPTRVRMTAKAALCKEQLIVGCLILILQNIGANGNDLARIVDLAVLLGFAMGGIEQPKLLPRLTRLINEQIRKSGMCADGKVPTVFITGDMERSRPFLVVLTESSVLHIFTDGVGKHPIDSVISESLDYRFGDIAVQSIIVIAVLDGFFDGSRA